MATFSLYGSLAHKSIIINLYIIPLLYYYFDIINITVDIINNSYYDFIWFLTMNRLLKANTLTDVCRVFFRRSRFSAKNFPLVPVWRYNTVLVYVIIVTDDTHYSFCSSFHS